MSIASSPHLAHPNFTFFHWLSEYTTSQNKTQVCEPTDLLFIYGEILNMTFYFPFPTFNLSRTHHLCSCQIMDLCSIFFSSHTRTARSIKYSLDRYIWTIQNSCNFCNSISFYISFTFQLFLLAESVINVASSLTDTIAKSM